MTNNEELRRMRALDFRARNGRVLRTINILRYQYNRLDSIQRLLAEDGIAEDQYLDSVNFLADEGYIHLRDIHTRLGTTLADSDYKRLAAKLTAKGIRLLAGGIADDMVEV